MFLFRSEKSADQWHQEGLNHYNQSKWKEAETCWKQELSIRERDSPDSLTLAVTYYNIGKVYYNQNQWDDALQFHQQALSIEKKQAPDSLDLAITYNQIGMVYYNQNQWDDALQFFQQALSIRKKQAPDSLTLASTYHNIGMVYSDQNQWDDALRFHQQALSIRKKQAPDSLDLADTYHNIGHVYYYQSQWDDALQFYQQAVSIRKKQAPDSLDLASTYHEIGHVYYDQNQWDDALRFLQQAVSIRKKQAPDSLDLANTYHNIGQVYYNQNQWDDALRFLQQTLSIEKKQAPDSLDLASTYHEIGNVYYYQSQWDDALRFHQQALSIRKKQAPDSLTLALTYYRIGVVFEKQNQLNSALHHGQLALGIQTRLEPSSLDLAHTYGSLGISYGKLHRVDQARSHLETALAVMKVKEPDSKELAEVYHHLGLVFLKQHQADRAQDYLKQALAIREQKTPNTLDLANTLCSLGDALDDQNELAQAKHCYDRALAIQKLAAPHSLDLANTYKKAGSVDEKQMHYDDALHFYKLALAIEERLKPDSMELAHTCHNLGVVLERLNQARAKLRNTMQSLAVAEPVELPIEYIDLINTDKELGKGFFGIVLQGYDRELDARFAIKVIHDHLLQANALDVLYARGSFEREIQTLRQFNHANIAKLYGYHLSEDLRSKVCLVFELAERGSLEKFWADDFGRSQLSWQRRIQIALDVATALSYLHGGGEGIEACFHRDIKSANICLKHNFTAQLIDCGLAKFVKEDGSAPASSATKKVGTPGYICPMYLENEIPYCDKCDVYSFGMVLIELMVGRVQNFAASSSGRPRNFRKHYVANFVENPLAKDADELAGEWDPTVSTEFAALALKCLHQTDEDKRPRMSMVVETLQTLVSQYCRPKTESEYQNPASPDTQSWSGSKFFDEGRLCRGCKVKSIHCLPCNNKIDPHLHCKSCLDRHVLDNYGQEKIPCPFEGCKSQPFSDCQICSMAESNTFSLHTNTRMQNQMMEMMRKRQTSSADGQEQIDKYHQESLKLLTPIHARTEERCPRLFLLFQADTPSILRHPREWVHRKTTIKARLYFYCAHSYERVESPIKLTVTKEWWIQAQPAIFVAVTVLRASKMVTGIPLDFSPVDAKGADDNVKELFGGAAPPVGNQNKPDELFGKAFELIADKAEEDKNFRNVMSPVYKDGKVTWVLNKYKHEYDM